MPFTDEIFKRATIRGFTDYLLYKDTLGDEKRDYETRMKDAFKVFDDLMEKYKECQSFPLVDKVNSLVSEAVDVYTEIGLQAGIMFVFDMMKNAKFNHCAEEKRTDAIELQTLVIKSDLQGHLCCTMRE